MDLTSQIINDTQVVTANAKRIDAAVAISFKDAMRAETDGGPARTLLDLRQVSFVDSSGLGAIVAAMKALGPDRRLDLSGLTRDVDKVFRLTRMDSVFDIYENVEQATARAAG